MGLGGTCEGCSGPLDLLWCLRSTDNNGPTGFLLGNRIYVTIIKTPLYLL